MMKVRPTSTDCAGNGCYTADNGAIYYGNPQNGYLVETEQTRRLREQKEAWNKSSQKSYSGYTSSPRTNMGSDPSILEMLFLNGVTKAGWKLGTKLGSFIGKVVPTLIKLLFVVGFLPLATREYFTEFVVRNSHIGCKLLSLAGMLGILALMAYGVYRKIKGQKSIAKQVFYVELATLIGIYYLNYKNEGMGLPASAFMAVFVACTLRAVSGWLEMIIAKVYRKRILNKRKNNM